MKEGPKSTRRDFLKLASVIVAGCGVALSLKGYLLEANEKQEGGIQDKISSVDLVTDKFDSGQVKEMMDLFNRYIDYAIDLGVCTNRESLPQICIMPGDINISVGMGMSVRIEAAYYEAGKLDPRLEQVAFEISKGKVVLRSDKPVIILNDNDGSVSDTGKNFAHELTHHTRAENFPPGSMEMRIVYDDRGERVFEYNERDAILMRRDDGIETSNNYLGEIVASLTEEKLYSMEMSGGIVQPIYEKLFFDQGEPFLANILTLLGALNGQGVRYMGMEIGYDELWKILTDTRNGVKGLLDYATQNTISSRSPEDIKIEILKALCRVDEYQGADQFLGKY